VDVTGHRYALLSRNLHAKNQCKTKGTAISPSPFRFTKVLNPALLQLPTSTDAITPIKPTALAMVTAKTTKKMNPY
jgi:hypothetical protein